MKCHSNRLNIIINTYYNNIEIFNDCNDEEILCQISFFRSSDLSVLFMGYINSLPQ